MIPGRSVWALYHVEGLTAADVGRKLGTSRSAVLRAAHDLGMPVRVGGAVIQARPQEIELVSALYADPLVAASLACHGIGQVPPGGPIWQRFPQPVPLTARLVDDLCAGSSRARP